MADSSPQVPPLVSANLNKFSGWLVNSVEKPTMNSAWARALIVSDGGQCYQIIVPGKAFTDLRRLKHLDWLSINTISEDSSESISAIPGAYGLPTIIDQRLLAMHVLTIPGNTPDSYYQIDGVQYENTAKIYDFCHEISLDPTPVDREHDLTQIHGSLKTFTTQRITSRLEETLSIPPLPEAASGIIALQSNPFHSLNDLAEVIELDPSLSARIIGWANSAYYQLENPVTSVNQAIIRVLGFEKVKAIALGLALNSSLTLPDAHVRGLSPYWLSAVFCASTMEAISPLIQLEPRPDTGLAYLSGLLHNFGMLILGHVFSPMYADICKHQEANRHLPHTFADQHVLGIPREVISGALLEAWSLPQSICDAIRFQHVQNYQADNATYVKMLQLSQQLLSTEGIGDYPKDRANPEIMDTLGLNAKAIKKVSLTIEQSSEELNKLATAIAH